MNFKGIAATLVGAVALVAFGIFSYYLIRHVGEAQPQWDRLVYVFSGVEAVAFGATGYFFGKEVNRARAEKAEEKAGDAEGEAKKDHGEKARAESNLRSLVNYINVEAAGRPSAALASDDRWDVLSRFAKTL
jgi:uncharacterized membrane protein YuzA (DUF378 family)